LKSLEKLIEADVSCHPYITASFSLRKNLDSLTKRLGSMSPLWAGEVEIRELIAYSHITNRIQKHGLKYYSAYTHERVPAEQI